MEDPKLPPRPLEYRGKGFRVQSDDENKFDELVVGMHVHLEMMDDKTLWIRLGKKMTYVNIKTGVTSEWIDT